MEAVVTSPENFYHFKNKWEDLCRREKVEGDKVWSNFDPEAVPLLKLFNRIEGLTTIFSHLSDPSTDDEATTDSQFYILFAVREDGLKAVPDGLKALGEINAEFYRARTNVSSPIPQPVLGLSVKLRSLRSEVRKPFPDVVWWRAAALEARVKPHSIEMRNRYLDLLKTTLERYIADHY